MIPRLTFFVIAAFWVTMNFLLWRAEFGSHTGDTPVPLELVWQKILTAPDASSLSIFQNNHRSGYCEFSTSVGQQMAAIDDDKLPPEGLAAKAGYQIHLAGNAALGDFTNRIKFDCRAQFFSATEWRDFTLKISSRSAALELHSAATNQSVHVKITSDGAVMEHDLALADLQNPNAIIRIFAGNYAGALLGGIDFPVLAPGEAAQKIQWQSHRTRLKIGTEFVPVYRLETTMLGNVISVDASTLGEILRVQLPGGFSARIDELSR